MEPRRWLRVLEKLLLHVKHEIAIKCYSQWNALPTDAFLLDVRDDDEFAEGHVEGAINIPLAVLRDRIAELPNDKTLHVYCGVGQRACYAVRTLIQNGYDARDISGGWITAGMTGAF